MINRIRDIRRQKGLTLADVAARCTPPTTAQTIGRLETGMRSLSLAWMNRIAAALEIEAELLVRAETENAPCFVARITAQGAEALPAPREALLPVQLNGEGPLLALSIEATIGDYRTGDQLWLRQAEPADYPRLFNRDVLAPRPGGRFAFGRLIDLDSQRIAILPHGAGQRQIVIEHPAWLAAAAMLVRPL
ncbi:MAG: helix-turn-helix transcriptional regulator [Novosphingobium sp.]